MTSGDAFHEGVEASEHTQRPTSRDYRHYGELRERETRTAMRALGVDEDDVQFLGFPDGGLCLIAAHHTSADGGEFESPYTERSRPPAAEQIVHGVRYRSDDVRREVARVVDEFRPTIVAMPYGRDLHPDHCATYVFAWPAVTDAIRADRSRPRVLQYLVHHDGWPDVNAGEPLLPPIDVPETEGQWQQLPLTPVEADAKRRALASYRSQMLVIAPFLQSFERGNELFLDTDRPLATECWCDASARVALPAAVQVAARRR